MWMGCGQGPSCLRISGHSCFRGEGLQTNYIYVCSSTLALSFSVEKCHQEINPEVGIIGFAWLGCPDQVSPCFTAVSWRHLGDSLAQGCCCMQGPPPPGMLFPSPLIFSAGCGCWDGEFVLFSFSLSGGQFPAFSLGSTFASPAHSYKKVWSEPLICPRAPPQPVTCRLCLCSWDPGGLILTVASARKANGLGFARVGTQGTKGVPELNRS